MSVGSISSVYDALPLGLAIQGAFKPPSSISPTRYVDAVRDIRTGSASTVRPSDPTRGVDPPQRTERQAPVGEPRRRETPVRGTAFQTNTDGDSVTLGSRLTDLSESEQRALDELKKRDQEVRTHEQAHVAAAGGLGASAPTYTFKTGPDGKRYAVGGKVQIDTSPGRTPEETIAKAQQIRRAALAPAEPSQADRAVAAKASRMEAQARAELKQGESESAAEIAAGLSDTPRTAPGADAHRTDNREAPAPGIDVFA